MENTHHGYRFDGEGRCVHLPGLEGRARIAKALSTPRLEVIERDGFAWARAKAWGGQSAPPQLPYLDDPAFHTFVWSAEARYDGEAAAGTGSAGVISRLFARGVDGRFGRFIAPCVAQLEYRRGEATAMVISALFTPRSDLRLSVWAVITTRRVPGVPAPLVRSSIRPFFALAVLQDRRILALQARAQRAFPSARPVMSPTDVLRPHIEQLLQHGPSLEPFAKRLTLPL